MKLIINEVNINTHIEDGTITIVTISILLIGLVVFYKYLKQHKTKSIN